MNSDKTPDYKGIELKSHRDKRSSKKNVLFTQTPDWGISKLKSGREIVESTAISMKMVSRLTKTPFNVRHQTVKCCS